MARTEPLLFALLDARDSPIRGRTRIQKYTFLLQERADVDGYEFEARDYGPFARELYQDVDDLERRGWIDEQQVELEDGAIWYDYDIIMDAPVDQRLEHIAYDTANVRTVARDLRDAYADASLHDLLRDVYSNHPQMAVNSIY